MIHTKIRTSMTGQQAYEASKLQHVFIKLNERCNARCSFCHCWTIEEDKLAVDAFDLVEQLKELEPAEVNLSGGEVLLYRDFWSLLDAGARRIPWSITTNGSVLGSASKIPRLRAAGVRRFYLSLDSHVAAQHDASRHTPGLFEAALRTVAEIRRQGWDVELIVNHVVTRLNAGQIAEALEAFAAAGFDAINLIPIKDAPDLFLSAAQISAYYTAVLSALSRGRVPRDFFMNGNFEIFGRSVEDFSSAGCGQYRFAYKQGCAIPALSMFIDCATGKVFPCDTTYWRKDSTAYVMGNAAHERLRDIWQGSRFREFRSAMFPRVGYPCAHQCDPNNVARPEVPAAGTRRLPLLPTGREAQP